VTEIHVVELLRERPLLKALDHVIDRRWCSWFPFAPGCVHRLGCVLEEDFFANLLWVISQDLVVDDLRIQ